MALLTRDQILQVQDLRTETVTVREWGGEVMVRGMTGAQRDAFEQSLLIGRQTDRGEGGDSAMAVRNVRARLVAFSVVDEAGEPLFGMDDIEALGKKSASALDRLMEAAQRVSAMTEKDIADLGKPSAPTDGASSTSGSPES